ncbi:unnamed protein product [Sphenostylis stenocarpa]|uniref:CCT domain-containing protein n=1 Tax=Sphenostylis stenocarpa TaxID=92480 RepID=A0AA86TB24_9FABA|nr:unnamed protein product [Sphenostylis stenocarpa]
MFVFLSRRTYGFLFDWLYPAHMPLLLKGVSHWTDTPEVTTPLLKFMAEFVLNKAQRLTFDSSSPNGILLFREVSILIVAYGSRVLTLPNAADIYTYKYKGIWICLTILSRGEIPALFISGAWSCVLLEELIVCGRAKFNIWHQMTALSGNYVNFGVFELYGDRALSDALDAALKMTLSIPMSDILAYRKVAKYYYDGSHLVIAFMQLTRAYFAFLEVLFNSHITFVLNLDANTFMHMVGSLESGLKGLDTSISSQVMATRSHSHALVFRLKDIFPLNILRYSVDCASAVDNLAAFYFNNITMGEAPNLPASVNLARHIAECPNLFPEILKTLFEIILFEDCGNQWSLSRPMLSLILINEQIFSDLKAQILASQPMDQHQRLSSCFDKLMADVTLSIDSKNRDKFTQNLTNCNDMGDGTETAKENIAIARPQCTFISQEDDVWLSFLQLEHPHTHFLVEDQILQYSSVTTEMEHKYGSASHRAASLNRFRQKRKQLCFANKIRYRTRQEATLRVHRSKSQIILSKIHESGQEDIHSVNCGISSKYTPMMRRGPSGPGSLCNACGLSWANRGVFNYKKAI